MNTWACHLLAAMLLIQLFPSLGAEPTGVPCAMATGTELTRGWNDVGEMPCMHPDAPECTEEQQCPAPCAPVPSQQACSQATPVIAGTDNDVQLRPMVARYGPPPYLPPHLRPPITHLS